MKVAIYTPYLDTFGGGERYMLTIAEFLAKGHQVDVLLDRHLATLNRVDIKNTLSKRLNLNLQTVNFRDAPLGAGSSLFKRLAFLKNYDLFFCLTDGSIFYSTAKRNILHIQSPIKSNHNQSVKRKFKLSSWDLIIYNSNFTKTHAEGAWLIKSEVVYPPVDISELKPLNKKPQIISVGRFFGYLKTKKHEVMIKSFIEMSKNHKLKAWSLHLAGSVGTGDVDYLNDLQKMAEGYPIYFYPNLDYAKLTKLYGQSSIYWHAAGFEEVDPTKMEHFGITTVEAMAAGCVPVVINRGGQTEIVDNGQSGYLWSDLAELEGLTLKLIQDKALLTKFSKAAARKSLDFTKDKFQHKIEAIIK